MSYRVRQFFHLLAAPLVRDDLEQVRTALTPVQWKLFLRMSAADQQHGLAVYRTLEMQGVRSADLLVAALLHDVGKAAAPPPLWVRVGTVLLGRFGPRRLERWMREDARGWRRQFVTYCRHAEVGAEWAAQAGCSALTVALIRHHHGPLGCLSEQDGRLLALLQEADGSR